jgi:actin related protein 2/3 complex subunit 1A/1B
VNSVDLDKSGLFLISGSCDMRVQIVSAYIPEVDDELKFDENLTFPAKKKFGEVLFKINTKAWINDVTFSPSGTYAFVGSHNSTLIIVKGQESETLNLSHSPAAKIIPLNDENIILIGYDRHFYKYSCANQNKKWQFVSSLTKQDLAQATTETEEKKDEGGASFKDKVGVFKNINKKVSLVVTTNKNALKNVHAANIISTTLIANNLVTADLAGYIKLWPL